MREVTPHTRDPTYKGGKRKGGRFPFLTLRSAGCLNEVPALDMPKSAVDGNHEGE